ncbi:DUF6192 family protein [Streptomyces alboflavus]|uniref:DUF6192 family protein n=1 Tax=Streptomyces alboflavus TaxID=67267 RepID=UPI0036867171
MRTCRYTAGRWPRTHRAEGVAFEIHRILEKLEDRFERITQPPRHPRSGKPQWTGDGPPRGAVREELGEGRGDPGTTHTPEPVLHTALTPAGTGFPVRAASTWAEVAQLNSAFASARCA